MILTLLYSVRVLPRFNEPSSYLRMTHSVPSSDGSTSVDPTYHWLTIDKNTPIGSKIQLINKSAGVAIYGSISSHIDCWFTHWAPLPKFDD